MKKIIAFIRQYSFFLKLIFFGSILVFVANQFTAILNGMSLAELGTKMRALPLPRLFLLFCCGLLGSFLMAGYDYTAQNALQKMGQKPQPVKKWLPLAFMINSINNLVGFGGVVGATLRGKFYGADLPKEKVLGTVSKMAFFVFTGISILCGVALGALFLGPVAEYYRQYWPWLLGGSLYWPILVFFSYLKRKNLFAEFFPQGIVSLLLASLLQWSSAFGVFWSIGSLLGFQLDFWSLFVLFIATSLIGMLTMVPGGAGTFDVLTIYGLSAMGISHEGALLWLLYYRLSYYLVPFLFGGSFFLQRTGVQVNQFFDGLPRLLGQKLAHLILTGAVYFAGITILLLSTVTNLSNLGAFFSFITPFSFDFFDQTLNMIVGILLLGLARGLANKVRKAYLPTLLVLLFSIANTITRTANWRLIVVYLIILGAVYFSRGEFYREKLVYSFEQLLFDGSLLLCLGILYAVAGYYATNQQRGELISGWFILFPSAEVWFKGLLGLGLALVVLVTLLTYLMQGPQVGSSYQEERVQAFVAQYGATSETPYFDHARRRSYFYQVDKRDCLYFNFEKKANKLFVYGDPLGDPAHWGAGLTSFMTTADLLGYQLAFYRVSPAFVELLHDYGFSYLKIGEEGYAEGALTASEPVAFSTASYRAYYQLSPAALGAIGKKAYLKGVPFALQAPLALLEEGDELQAVACFYYCEEQQVVFLLDYWGQTPTLEANILSKYLAGALKKGYRVDLGLLPLANVGRSSFSFVTERIVQWVYYYGLNQSTLQAQRTAKENFVTSQENRYLAYRRNANGVVTLVQGLLLLRKRKAAKKPLLAWVLASDEAES